MTHRDTRDAVAKRLTLAMVYGMARRKAQEMAEEKPKSDQRFRSFAERFLVTRSNMFSTDPDQLAKDTWQCVQDARRAYMMIKAVGYGKFEDADDPF